MDDFNFDDKDKKDANDFLSILAMMAEVNKQQETDDHVGRVLYSIFMGMRRAGFNEEQALELVKCFISGAFANDALKK